MILYLIVLRSTSTLNRCHNASNVNAIDAIKCQQNCTDSINILLLLLHYIQITF